MAEIPKARTEVIPTLIYDGLVAEMGDPLAPFKVATKGKRRKRPAKSQLTREPSAEMDDVT